MCVSLSLASLSSRVVFDLEAIKNPLEARKKNFSTLLGLLSKFYRLVQRRVKVELWQIE